MGAPARSGASARGAGGRATAFAAALLFTAFAMAHAVIARLAGPVLALDDAKLNVVAQSFQRGYLPSNPPLFEWTLIVAQHAAGFGPLGFALTKSFFFGALGAFAYLAAKEMLADRRWAFLSALSLLLLFQFGWNFHQAYTHTTALIAAVSLFWFALARLFRARTTAGYALLGLALGVGMLAKYSFAGAAFAAFAAFALQREGRRLLADARLVLSFVLAAAIFAPHAYWLMAHNAGAADIMAARLSGGGAEPHWRRVAEGLPNAAGVMIAFFLPFGIVAAVLLRKDADRLAARPAPALKVARDAALIGAAGLLAAIAVIGMERMEDRYVIPFLYPAMFVLTAALKDSDARRSKAKILVACAASFALFCLGFKAVTVFRPGPPFCDDCRQFVEFEPVRDGLLARGFGGEGTLVAFDETTAGNLRRLFPAARVLYASLPAYAPPRAKSAECFFVWSLDLGPAAPETLSAGIGEAQASSVVSLTRPLAGKRRMTNWTIAAIDPDGPDYDRWCARARSPR